MPTLSPLDDLARRLEGELLTGAFDRGRYATDASMYQVMPLGVVVPRSVTDLQVTLEFANRHEMPLLARGGGTSQCGQTVSRGLVIDCSKHLNGILDLDLENRRCRVQPGIVLDQLNRALKPHGVWFPVDVSTASRATIGGMTANNSCGSRSIRYGLMRDNVASINALFADGGSAEAGAMKTDRAGTDPRWSSLHALGMRERDEILSRFPRVMRRVGGYNIDALAPGIYQPAAGAAVRCNDDEINAAHLLVGSEGTLAL